MFSKFAAWYGHVWRSQFKDEGFLGFAKKEWQEGLSDFNEATLNKVMMHCRKHHEFPPTLPQVIQCCLQIQQQSQFYVAKNDDVSATTTVVESCLRECKSFLTK